MKKKLYCFDFDGTLTTSDTLLEFIKYAKGKGRFLMVFLMYSPLLVLMKLHLYPNWKAKQQIFQIMWEQSRLGIASIMVSSELEELLEVCQRILIMRDGVIQQEVYPEDVKIDDLYALCMGGEK